MEVVLDAANAGVSNLAGRVCIVGFQLMPGIVNPVKPDAAGYLLDTPAKPSVFPAG